MPRGHIRREVTGKVSDVLIRRPNHKHKVSGDGKIHAVAPAPKPESVKAAPPPVVEVKPEPVEPVAVVVEEVALESKKPVEAVVAPVEDTSPQALKKKRRAAAAAKRKKD